MAFALSLQAASDLPGVYVVLCWAVYVLGEGGWMGGGIDHMHLVVCVVWV